MNGKKSQCLGHLNVEIKNVSTYSKINIANIIIVHTDSSLYPKHIYIGPINEITIEKIP